MHAKDYLICWSVYYTKDLREASSSLNRRKRMNFFLQCKICSGNLAMHPGADLEPAITRCGKCEARYYVTLGLERHTIRYLGNLEPMCRPVIGVA